MKTGDYKILAGLVLASIHMNLFHVVLLPSCIGFLILYIGILQKERQAGFFQMNGKEMRVYRAAGAALVLVTAFFSFLSMFWGQTDGTIWALLPCMLEYVVLYGLMEGYTAGAPRHSYASELRRGYAMVMGAALCGYAVSLILHVALWQLFAAVIILVCRFMVVVEVAIIVKAEKEKAGTGNL